MPWDEAICKYILIFLVHNFIKLYSLRFSLVFDQINDLQLELIKVMAKFRIVVNFLLKMYIYILNLMKNERTWFQPWLEIEDEVWREVSNMNIGFNILCVACVILNELALRPRGICVYEPKGRGFKLGIPLLFVLFFACTLRIKFLYIIVCVRYTSTKQPVVQWLKSWLESTRLVVQTPLTIIFFTTCSFNLFLFFPFIITISDLIYLILTYSKIQTCSWGLFLLVFY